MSNLTISERSRIISLKDMGYNISQIAEELNISRFTVRKWIQCFESEGHVNTAHRQKRAHIITPERIQQMREVYSVDPFTPTRVFAEEFDCSPKAVRNALHRAGVHHRKPAKKIQLTQDHKMARLRFAERNKKNGPKSLVILCERAIKKYKLIPDPAPKKPFTPPETFSVVGGKPLRKRSEGKHNYKVTKPKKERKRSNPKSLVELCEIVIQEYNLLPQTEELLVSQNTPVRKRSRSQSDVVEKRPRGRPRKSAQQDQNDTSMAIQIKRPRGRPAKDPSAASYIVEYSSTQPTSFAEQPISNIRIKEELDLPPDVDPLRDEDDFTVVIKEEHDYVDDKISHEVSEAPVVPIHQATPQALVINPEAYLQVPGPSRIGFTQTPKFMTVVMDEYQIFANSIAEQLRALPVNRALLLQLDIQSMIDNEKQLISDEH